MMSRITVRLGLSRRHSRSYGRHCLLWSRPDSEVDYVYAAWKKSTSRSLNGLQAERIVGARATGAYAGARRRRSQLAATAPLDWRRRRHHRVRAAKREAGRCRGYPAVTRAPSVVARPAKGGDSGHACANHRARRQVKRAIHDQPRTPKTPRCPTIRTRKTRRKNQRGRPRRKSKSSKNRSKKALRALRALL